VRDGERGGADLDLERRQAVLAVVGGQLRGGHLAVLVLVEGAAGRHPLGGKVEAGRPPGQEQLRRRRPLQLLPVQRAVTVDVQVLEQVPHEVVPDRPERLVVNADVQADQHRPGVG